MTDLATLGIIVDSRQVKAATGDLEKLTVAGGRAEASAVGLGGGVKTAGAQAAAMAVAAQASARAAMDQAAGFKVATSAARVNTVAMRETLVVARELSRGNFSRVPGSLTLLAQGIGSQGGIKAFGSALADTLGLVKTVQNAELAEQAVAAAAAAAAVQNAAERAAANIITADTEVALAEAQLRVTAGTSAEAAAQVRLAEAHDAVAAAAAEAAVAEDALATAMGRSAEAGAASAAATTRSVSGLGAALGVVGIAAGLAFAGVEGFKSEVGASGELDRFAEGLRLTSSQIEEAGGQVKYLGHNIQEITGLTVTWGDVARGTFDAVGEAAGLTASQFKSFWREAFLETAQVGVSAAQVIAGAFAAVGSIAKDIKGLAIAVVAPGNPLAGASAIPSPQKIGQDALNAFEKQFSATGKFFHETLPNAITNEADKRLQKLSDRNNPAKPPKAKKPRRNPADDEIAKLDAQIAGEKALADAYLTSDVAVIRAESDQKAMTLAVEKHATATQTAALKQREFALAIATITTEGAKQISNLNADAGAREKVNALVAAGIIPATQANQAIQNELALRQQIAALAAVQEDLADARHAKDQKRISDDIAAILRLQHVIAGLPVSQAADEAAKNTTAAQAQIAANDNEIAQLKLKNDLLGHSNQEIAISLTNLQTMQYLAANPGIDASTAAQLAASNLQKALAAVQTPFQQWAKDIPQDADAITQAFQSIETRGLDSLSSAITDVITGAKSLKDAFKETAQSIISDILQMIIKMLIFRAISSIFGSAFTPSGVNIGANLTPAASLPGLSANGNVFSGGNIIPFAAGGIVASPTLFPMSGGRTGLMGEAGAEAVLPLGRDNHGRLGVRMNDNQSGPIELVISFGDAPDFAPFVESVSTAHAAQAVKVSTTYTNETARRIGRPKMMGGR